MPVDFPYPMRLFRVDEDVPRLSRLLAEVEAVDQVGINSDEETLRAQLSWLGHDPARDRSVVEAPDNPDRLLGFSTARFVPATDGTLTAEFDVQVHPSWRRRGIGAALLDQIVLRAREHSATRLMTYIDQKCAGWDTFLRRHGFQIAPSYTEMRLPVDRPFEVPAWPAGYQLRTFDTLQDNALLARAFTRCYQGLWGHHTATEEDVTGWLAFMKPESLFILFGPDGDVAGMSRVECSAERTERNGVPTGYIDGPGVVPELRSPDLYRALALNGMRWLQDRGQAVIDLESWGDPEETLGIYRDLGFAVTRRVSCYYRDVDARP